MVSERVTGLKAETRGEPSEKVRLLDDPCEVEAVARDARGTLDMLRGVVLLATVAVAVTALCPGVTRRCKSFMILAQVCGLGYRGMPPAPIERGMRSGGSIDEARTHGPLLSAVAGITPFPSTREAIDSLLVPGSVLSIEFVGIFEVAFAWDTWSWEASVAAGIITSSTLYMAVGLVEARAAFDAGG